MSLTIKRINDKVSQNKVPTVFATRILKIDDTRTFSPEQELRFSEVYNQHQLGFLRAGLAIALVSYALYALADKLAAPHSADQLLALRFFVICPTLSFLLALSWHPLFAKVGQKAYMASMLTMGCLHLWLISILSPYDPSFHSYYAGLILIICGLGILGGLRTRCAAITGSLIIGGYQWVAIVQQDLLSSPETIGIYAMNNLFLITALVFSVLTSYLLEGLSRRNFIQSEILKTAVDTMKHSEQKLLSSLNEQSEWASMFTRFIRHELSNSVTGAATSLQLIARKTTQEDVLVYLSRADRCLRDLRELLFKASEATSIDDALRVSDYEAVNLNELLDELVSTFTQDHRHNIQLISESKIITTGSHVLLSQMFRNLLDNALRHSAPDSPVTVFIKNNQVEVVNIGDGLPEDVERLFELGHTSQEGKAGLFGLGLYIVKKIALAHHAEIKAEQLPDASGARFTVRFPTGLPLTH